MYDRGLKNNVRDLKLVDAKGIREIEPHVRGIRAIHSPHTGIVDWALVTEYYAKDFQDAGGEIFFNFEAKKFSRSLNNDDFPVTVTAANGQQVFSKYILTCGGLQADKIAALTGNKNPPKIVPFRGEYLLLSPEKANWIRGNVYPGLI